jgi:IS605 OrfB family transposase
MSVVRRSVAVPLLFDGNSLADFLELERAYKLAKQTVLDYLAERYKGRVSYFRVWHEVKEMVKQHGLPFAYQQQAVKDAVETFNAWVETGGARPTVRRVSPYADERAWRIEGQTAISIRLMNTRHIVDLWPHKRFWRFEWLVRIGKASRANTIRLKRIRDKVYAVFTYELTPEGERVPTAVTAFDVNENTVVVAKIDLRETVDKVAQWNRNSITPPISIHVFRTDFGRLAKRYAAIRRRWAEELAVEINGRRIPGTTTREFRKRVKKLRERNRKRDRVNKVAHELTKEPAVLVTEDLGERPQEEMIQRKRDKELRHRVKQTPMKAVLNRVEDKAKERGVRLVLVSSRRNSRICPIHGVEMTFPLGPKLGFCPRGHWVHRDVASVLNMLRKVADELKEYCEIVRKTLDVLDEKTLEEWIALVLRAERPAVLTRASPMTRPGERAANRPG